MNRHKQQAAFTLIEVLVALVIIVVAFTSVYFASTQVTSNMSYLRDKTLAHWVARNVIVQARVGLINFKTQPQHEGTDTMLGHRFSWKISRQGTDDQHILALRVSVCDAGHSVLATLIGTQSASSVYQEGHS